MLFAFITEYSETTDKELRNTKLFPVLFRFKFSLILVFILLFLPIKQHAQIIDLKAELKETRFSNEVTNTGSVYVYSYRVLGVDSFYKSLYTGKEIRPLLEHNKEAMKYLNKYIEYRLVEGITAYASPISPLIAGVFNQTGMIVCLVAFPVLAIISRSIHLTKGKLLEKAVLVYNRDITEKMKESEE
jgi:hypothetical protein